MTSSSRTSRSFSFEKLESRTLLSVSACDLTEDISSGFTQADPSHPSPAELTSDDGHRSVDHRPTIDTMIVLERCLDDATQSQQNESESPPVRQRSRRIGRTDVYSVIEIGFKGPFQTPLDTPSRDIQLKVTFEHEKGTEITVPGFWDGDGRGGSTGNLFVVRFTPTHAGNWTLVRVTSNVPSLNRQRQGDYVQATEGEHHGFWVPATNALGHSWYRRSDGTIPYIVGNTHYTLLTETDTDGESTGGSIVTDIVKNAQFFNKLRFSLLDDLAPHPKDRPFLDDDGLPTNEGEFAHRPNPAWFYHRADRAVQTAFEFDVIADLIVSGIIDYDSRRALTNCKQHNIDRCERPWQPETAYLNYVAARYGSYPNVWMTLVNEWDLRHPDFRADEIVGFGEALRDALAYPVPLSVHGKPGPWNPQLDGNWNDHVIIQGKTKRLDVAFEGMLDNVERMKVPKPIVNDEASYQGAGDGHTEIDTVAALAGVFLGGGYGTTGYKTGKAEGAYVWGGFSPNEHTSSDNLRWMREQIDSSIAYWQMRPTDPRDSIFEVADWARVGALEAPGQQYVFGSRGHSSPTANLPAGKWQIEVWDLIEKTRQTIATDHVGPFDFETNKTDVQFFVFTRNSEVDPDIFDLNGDGRFNSSDLVQVFMAGKYELPPSDPNSRASRAEGDWNGDGYFNTRDLVFAFQYGNYGI